MKQRFLAILILMAILCSASCAGQSMDTLTYAVFPYLPDPGYYREFIESRWDEIEPDIDLIRAEWDCYTDGAPEGIDVVRKLPDL